MRAMTTLGAALVVLVGASSAVCPAPAGAYQAITELPVRRQWVSGQVVAVNPQQGLMAVLLEGSSRIATIQRRNFVVEAHAMIAENGRPVSLQELLGKPVRIEFTMRDGLHRAHSIIVREMPTRV